MHFLHPLFAISLSLIAILCVRMTFFWVKGQVIPVRFGTIDGLRGYLAFFVFLHHAAVWSVYTRTDMWMTPQSHLYTHLGESSVALFFMITSFLFYDKLLNSEKKKFGWTSFFIGRLFRLTPLYIAVILALFFVVAVLSGWTLIDKPGDIVLAAMDWLFFTIPGAPTINHIGTGHILAGVTWSLPYEWCFYLVLPLIALTTGQRPPWTALAVAAMALAIAWYTGMSARLALIFLGGLIAARAVRYPRFTRFAQTTPASVLALVCLTLLLLFPTDFSVYSLILLTMAFCLIAAGTDLFGMLVAQTSRRLGELAYSIYLLHGILLFTMINFVVGKSNIAALSSIEYWLLIASLIPIVLGLSTFTFHYIEQPGIKAGNKLRTRWSTTRPTPKRLATAINKTPS